MRTILITNDDGIDSDGIRRLAAAAKKFGEVWVTAPESQRSAASQSITLREPIDVFPCSFPVEGVKAFSCTGTPADCVRAAVLHLMPEKPDIILSGINYGYNAASDIQYSATVGAAFEGIFQGILSAALSEQACSCHEVTDFYLPQVLERLFDQEAVPGQILNVNFPGCPLRECRGILTDRTVSRGMFFRDHYKELMSLPGGGLRLQVEGVYNEDAEEGTDFRAIIENYVSIGAVKNAGY